MRDHKAEYHFYKGLGICVKCHKEKAEPNRVMCYECLDICKEYDRKRHMRNSNARKQKDNQKYQDLKEKGICTYCKHEKTVPGKLKCQKCLNKIRMRKLSRKDGIPRSEWVSYGLCYLCGKNKLFEDKKICESCYKRQYESISKIMYIPNRNKYWKNENKLLYCK